MLYKMEEPDKSRLFEMIVELAMDYKGLGYLQALEVLVHACVDKALDERPGLPIRKNGERATKREIFCQFNT